LKASCSYKGPTEITAAAQVKEINAAVQGGFNVLIVAANDKDALVPALRAAQKRKVTVVTYDSDVAKKGRKVFVNQASSQGIGQALAKSASDLAGGSGDIAILSTTPDATNQNVWIDFMKEELAAKYPNVKVVATAYGLDKPEESTTETQGLIQKYPTIKAIVAPTSVGIVAAAKYVSRLSFKGQGFRNWSRSSK
jgi:ABC-type sugar transport system, periplasmic component